MRVAERFAESVPSGKNGNRLALEIPFRRDKYHLVIAPKGENRIEIVIGLKVDDVLKTQRKTEEIHKIIPIGINMRSFVKVGEREFKVESSGIETSSVRRNADELELCPRELLR